jgi:hypothetical protein
MLRRYWIRSETDQRVVKWLLVAAAFAFVAGTFAETRLERHAQDGAGQEVVQEAQAAQAAQPGVVKPAG